MKPERPGTKTVLIDIGYEHSMNKFEEMYGEFVTYKEIEQKSYIDFKELLFELINKEIKFRKHERMGNILTIRAEMFDFEIDNLTESLDDGKISLVSGWTIKEITIIKDDLMKNFEELNENI